MANDTTNMKRWGIAANVSFAIPSGKDNQFYAANEYLYPGKLNLVLNQVSIITWSLLHSLNLDLSSAVGMDSTAADSFATDFTTALNSYILANGGITGGAANQIVYRTSSVATGFITAPTVTSTFLKWNGSSFEWATIAEVAPATSSTVGGFKTGYTATVSTVAVALDTNSKAYVTLPNPIYISSSEPASAPENAIWIVPTA